MDYDTWKLMTPEEADGTANADYASVEVEVKIIDLGQHVIDEIGPDKSNITFDPDGSTLTTKLDVEVPLVHDDWERSCYLDSNDIENAVYDILNGCDYEILNWEEKK